MNALHVHALAPELVQRMRYATHDDFGHRLQVEPLDQGGPCRACLRRFRPGDRAILFSYRPNPADHPYDEIGPVFIHADACESYAEGGKFPAELASFRLTLRCYDRAARMVHAELLDQRDPQKALQAVFANPDIAYVNVRNAAWGCYIARVERA
jgi:hypothetical protein